MVWSAWLAACPGFRPNANIYFLRVLRSLLLPPSLKKKGSELGFHSCPLGMLLWKVELVGRRCVPVAQSTQARNAPILPSLPDASYRHARWQDGLTPDPSIAYGIQVVHLGLEVSLDSFFAGVSAPIPPFACPWIVRIMDDFFRPGGR